MNITHHLPYLFRYINKQIMTRRRRRRRKKRKEKLENFFVVS
jgi:hypothetical protein